MFALYWIWNHGIHLILISFKIEVLKPFTKLNFFVGKSYIENNKIYYSKRNAP